GIVGVVSGHVAMTRPEILVARELHPSLQFYCQSSERGADCGPSFVKFARRKIYRDTYSGKIRVVLYRSLDHLLSDVFGQGVRCVVQVIEDQVVRPAGKGHEPLTCNEVLSTRAKKMADFGGHHAASIKAEHVDSGIGALISRDMLV